MASLPEFYRQLALLLEARLPLPGSLQELAKGVAEAKLQTVLQHLAGATAAGEPLASAMAAHPRTFPALHIRLVAVGERGGVLPEVLNLLAHMTASEQHFVRQVRATMVYPSLVLAATLTVLVLLLTLVVPEFVIIYRELLGMEPLPAMTILVFGISDFLRWSWPGWVGLAAMVLVAVLWVLWRAPRDERALLTVCGCLPGGAQLMRQWDFARVCLVLSLLHRQRMPLPEALLLVAEVTTRGRLRRALPRWAEAVRSGRAVAEVLADTGSTSGLLGLAFCTQPEGRLAEALAELAGMHLAEAAAASQSVLRRLTRVSVVVMTVGVAFIVMAVYMPSVRLNSLN